MPDFNDAGITGEPQFDAGRRRTNNSYTEETINMLKLPKAEDCPYKAVGDCIIIIPMEVMDFMSSKLIIMPGVGATQNQKFRSRLLKGKVISVGMGVAAFDKFILPEHPKMGDIVYFEAHMMKELPGGFGLMKFESSLFILDESSPKAMEIKENDVNSAAKNEDGLRLKGDPATLGTGQKY